LKIIPASLKRLDEPLPFYSFLAAHSFLIGLLPFYLPVFLWGHGFQLADTALLIGATGAAFTVSLKFWQPAVRSLTTRDLLIRTFIIEALLVCTLLLVTVVTDSATSDSAEPEFTSAALILFMTLIVGGVSGTYNAWFWTTQRTMFLDMTQASNTGRQYGNFQIFVTVFLKVGILIGGLLLDSNQGRIGFLLLNLAIITGMIMWYRNALGEEKLKLSDGPNINLKSSFSYRDRCGSFPVFLLDGIFLFLESHFWLLSLFLVVQEDFSSLGLTVIALALFFAVTFYLLKNTIDKLTGNSVYLAATGLYALSWLLRAYVDAEMTRSALLVSLMIITFCSSFFRLAFNKRFFDLARLHNNTDYLLVKSYLSQCVLALFYIALALMLYQSNTDGTTYFPAIYAAAALLSFGYAMYRTPKQ